MILNVSLCDNDSGAPSEGAVWVLYCMLLWLSDYCQNVNVYTVRLSFRLYCKHDSIIKVSQLCLDVFHFQRKKKQLLWPEAFVCAYFFLWEWVNGWDYPRGLIISYSFPIKKKVESASPSLWKFPTTPSWRIMTKPSSSCWKRSTRGQSSSLPVKKTYGEECSTFWLHPRCSGALMTCHV